MNRLRAVTLTIFSVALIAAAAPQTPDKGSAGVAVPGARPPKQQTDNQLDADQTLFTVLAAINAAGYDTGANSTAAHPLRAYIRQQLADKDLPSIRALKEFYRDHKHGDPSEDLAQYISFALSVGGPPDFDFLTTTSRLPPDVRQLSELPTLLSAFYFKADIDDLWRQSQPAFDQVIAFYHRPLSRAILEANAYLRSETSGVLGHRFQIYVDLLGAPGQIQSRNYRTDTYVVMTPAIAATPERTQELAAEQVADVRHAHLHSLLDPLAVRYYQELDAKQDLLELAKTAPALEPLYKNDFMMLATESLIKAIEARLSAGPAAKRETMVSEALHEGFVLTPAFYDGLADYEKQDRAMRLYYPDLIKSINMKTERQRVAGIQFATARVKRGPDRAKPVQPKLTNAEKLLAEAEELSDRRQLDVARATLQKVLEEPPQPNVRARAYYGLARIAVLRKDPETAEKMFLKAIDAEPDGETRSWAYYYLGRLEDAADQREESVKYYRLAVDTPGGSRKAKDEAQKALDGESTPKNGSR
ncbi:MAG: tetratricopeptide repeat protein [Bryobacteraceae bacterium]